MTSIRKVLCILITFAAINTPAAFASVATASAAAATTATSTIIAGRTHNAPAKETIDPTAVDYAVMIALFVIFHGCLFLMVKDDMARRDKDSSI